MKYLKEYIERKASCLTGNENFVSIAKVDKFPVFFGVTDKPEKDDLYAKMEWFLEKETGLIQLNNLIPLDVLYQEQHAYGFGETWENHYLKFSEFLCQIKPSNVLEIGAGQGRIAQICTTSMDIQNWTIIEPNPTFEESDKIKVINGFFDRQFNIDSVFDTYTFSHVLEHAYDPKDFLVCIFEKMRISDNLIFSYPNLKIWLKKKYTNSLNFEHTIFLTVEHLETLLKNIGFVIVQRIDYLDHSHFFHVQKGEPPVVPLKYINNSEENRQLLNDFMRHHIDEVSLLNEKLNDLFPLPIYLFGAHIFSQYLKVFGLNTGNIVSVLDNSRQKIGKRLYGTNLFVQNPEVLRDIDNPVVILRAGPYNEEIKNQILTTINSETTFI
jgi:hypothetical protein